MLSTTQKLLDIYIYILDTEYLRTAVKKKSYGKKEPKTEVNT